MPQRAQLEANRKPGIGGKSPVWRLQRERSGTIGELRQEFADLDHRRGGKSDRQIAG